MVRKYAAIPALEAALEAECGVANSFGIALLCKS